MTPTEIILLLVLTAYAVYRQTQRHQVAGASRFKMALIYGGVGLLVGGFTLPDGVWGYTFFLASIALSVVVGWLRGRYTRLWRGADGEVYSQGTPLTVGLFLGLIAAKWTLGVVSYFTGIVSHGGFGEILIMIAVMIAFQAEIVWRRAQAVAPLPASPASPPASAFSLKA